MSKQFPSDQKDKFMLRLPDGMRERIAQAAEKEGRSMNAEIVRRLETTFPAPQEKKSGKRTSDALLSAIAEQVERLRNLGQELARLDEQQVIAEFVDTTNRRSELVSRRGIQEKRSKKK